MRTAGDPVVSALAQLSSAEANVAIDGSQSQVSQHRVYSIQSASFVVGETELRFHFSLPHDGASVKRLEIDGGAVDFEVLVGRRADDERERLVRALKNPAPLREPGLPLVVSEPVASSALSVEVDFEFETPLSLAGSLSGVHVPLDWDERNAGVVKLNVGVTTEQPLAALYSPFHELGVQRDGEHAATASHESRDVCTRFDMTVLVSEGEEALHLDALPFRYHPDEDGHVLLLLTPRSVTESEERLGRDIVVALDTSGSMLGEKIDQAKQALHSVLSGLDERDSLALVNFANQANAFSDAAQPATSRFRSDAADFVDALVAEGGTNLGAAVESAFAMLATDPGRPRYVVLLTDGVPTDGTTDTEALLDLARVRNEGRARLFTFGIGYDVNTVLLDRLAGEAGGNALYVRPGESVNDVVTSFFEQIEDPVLKNPVLTTDGFELLDVHPRALGDLFGGRTQLVVARTSGEVGTLTVRGQAGSREAEYAFDLTLPAYAFEHGVVPRVWALRHVGSLLSRIKLEGTSSELVDEVVAIARHYGVVTDFTYFVADENGDWELTYSDVPSDAVGAVAVNTSASISGYSQSGTASTSVPTEVRYFQDRNLRPRGGYFRDATLDADAEFVELHFGSALYFEFARDEAELAAAGLLSIAPDVEFEWLGRHFRVTDPEGTNAERMKPQDSAVPAPEFIPDSAGSTQVSGGSAMLSFTQGADEGRETQRLREASGTSEPSVACATSRRSDGAFSPWWALLVLSLVRRRGRWVGSTAALGPR